MKTKVDKFGQIQRRRHLKIKTVKNKNGAKMRRKKNENAVYTDKRKANGIRQKEKSGRRVYARGA